MFLYANYHLNILGSTINGQVLKSNDVPLQKKKKIIADEGCFCPVFV